MRIARTFTALALSAFAAGCSDPATLAEAPGRSLGTVTTNSTLTASISGPGQVRSGNHCEWIAIVSGGTTPYTYDWTDTRTGSHSSEQVYVRSFSLSATITLTVTDAAGQTVTKTKPVSISPSAPMCYA